MAYVDVAWAEGNVGLAQEHADRAFSLALKSGNPYLRVYAKPVAGFLILLPEGSRLPLRIYPMLSASLGRERRV